MVDPVKLFRQRAIQYSRDIMAGAEGPYATEAETMAVLSEMVSESQIRVPHHRARLHRAQIVQQESCRIINRRAVRFTPACPNCCTVLYDPSLSSCPKCGKPAKFERPTWTDRGWREVPRNAVAELVRTRQIKRFEREREFDRIGWLEMGWDGEIADWFGWPA